MTSKIKSWVAIGFLAQAAASLAYAASDQTSVTSAPPPTAPVQGMTTSSGSTSGAATNGSTTGGTSTTGSTGTKSSSGAQVSKPVQKTPIQSQSVNGNPSTTYAASGSEADWKMPGLPPLYNFGAMSGLGVIDSYGGVAILGTASLTVLDRGFVPDISNSVAAEIEAGPMITSGHGAFWYSLHMRWDFQKDSDWTFYALAGLAGNGTPSSLGGHFEIWPRIGAGAMYKITSGILLRGEVSHEFTGIGISIPVM
jgi:hypothetical protein